MRKYLQENLQATPTTASPSQNGTIFDALRRANVPFRIYTGDGFPQVGLLSGISIYDDIEDFANFAGDVADPRYDAA